jgi:hypothetical protein
VDQVNCFSPKGFRPFVARPSHTLHSSISFSIHTAVERIPSAQLSEFGFNLLKFYQVILSQTVYMG